MNEIKVFKDKVNEMFKGKEFVSPNLSELISLDGNLMRGSCEFNQEDNVLLKIEQNQKEEINKLRDLNHKKDVEIEALKDSAKKEKKRFWWTFSITTLITLAIGILGIIF